MHGSFAANLWSKSYATLDPNPPIAFEQMVDCAELSPEHMLLNGLASSDEIVRARNF